MLTPCDSGLTHLIRTEVGLCISCSYVLLSLAPAIDKRVHGTFLKTRSHSVRTVRYHAYPDYLNTFNVYVIAGFTLRAASRSRAVLRTAVRRNCGQLRTFCGWDKSALVRAESYDCGHWRIRSVECDYAWHCVRIWPQGCAVLHGIMRTYALRTRTVPLAALNLSRSPGSGMRMGIHRTFFPGVGKFICVVLPRSKRGSILPLKIMQISSCNFKFCSPRTAV